MIRNLDHDYGFSFVGDYNVSYEWNKVETDILSLVAVTIDIENIMCECTIKAIIQV